MKANNGNGNNPLRDMWETPLNLFKVLNEQYKFSYDCCATAENTKCHSWTNEFESEFDLKDWNIMCWMNPPFSKSKDMFTHFFQEVPKGVAIYRFDNAETKVWQDIIFPKCNWVFIFNKRIIYDGFEGESSRFPSALIGFNVDPPIGLKGTLIKIDLS